MSYAVKILTPAEADAVEAALCYDSQAPGLGDKFLEELNAAVARLGNNPAINRIRFEDVRRAAVGRFKFYGVYYLIHREEVWVVAVFHGRRHPRRLFQRRRQIG